MHGRIKSYNLFQPSNVDIEQVRVQAANEIRRIDMQLEKIDQFKDPNFEYVGSTIPELIKAEFLLLFEELILK